MISHFHNEHRIAPDTWGGGIAPALVGRVSRALLCNALPTGDCKQSPRGGCDPGLRPGSEITNEKKR